MENNEKNNGKNEGFGRKIAAFFGGRGFYIALFMCVALVGVYAWALLFDGGSNTGAISQDNGYDLSAAGAEVDAATLPVGSFGTALILSENGSENGNALPNVPENKGDDEGEPASAGGDTDAPDDESVAVSTPAVSEPDFFVWPVAGEVSREYSVETLSYDVTMGDWRTHAAMDIDAQMGAKVYAVADGTVESIDEDDMLGTVVTIVHGGGLRSIYANLGSVPTVSVGDMVTAGSVIGCVSDSAMGEIAQTSHLHFAMTRDGENIDPTAYLPEK